MKAKKVLTLNAATCSRCGQQTANPCECDCYPHADDGDDAAGLATMRTLGEGGCKLLRNSRTPPGYVPSSVANAGRMTPMPDPPWDGDDNLTANAEPDADGLVTNQGAPGGLLEVGLPWERMSRFRPKT